MHESTALAYRMVQPRPTAKGMLYVAIGVKTPPSVQIKDLQFLPN